jgi:hypothetical protein
MLIVVIAIAVILFWLRVLFHETVKSGTRTGNGQLSIPDTEVKLFPYLFVYSEH